MGHAYRGAERIVEHSRLVNQEEKCGVEDPRRGLLQTYRWTYDR